MGGDGGEEVVVVVVVMVVGERKLRVGVCVVITESREVQKPRAVGGLHCAATFLYLYIYPSPTRQLTGTSKYTHSQRNFYSGRVFRDQNPPDYIKRVCFVVSLRDASILLFEQHVALSPAWSDSARELL